MTLVAGGEGGITLRELHSCRAGPGSSELLLTPVFGAVVRVQSANGEALAISDGVYGRGSAWTHAAEENEQIEPVIGLPVAYFLVSDQRDWHLSPTRVTEHLILVASRQRHARVGGLEYEIDMPGYLPLFRVLTAMPIGKKLVEHLIELAPSGVPTGKLVLKCIGSQFSVKPDSLTGKRLGVLTLLEGDGQRVTVVFEKPCGRNHAYDGIPYGLYTARFQFNDWYRRIPSEEEPPITVQIGPVPAEFIIDMSRSGSVLPVLLDSDGVEYTGRVSLRLYNKSGTRFLAYNAAPYVIEGITPGRYWLAVDRLPGLDRSVQAAVPFDVEPDELTLPVLQLIR